MTDEEITTEATDTEITGNPPVIDLIEVTDTGSGVVYDALATDVPKEWMNQLPTSLELYFHLEVTDPDNEKMYLSLSDSMGNNYESIPVNEGSADFYWTTPSEPGSFIMRFTFTDESGMETVKELTFTAISLNIDLTLHQITSEGGYIEQDGPVSDAFIYIGDSENNKAVRGFISYDITGLSDATIYNTVLTFNLKAKHGDPSTLGTLSLCSTYWGADPLVQSDFMSPCKIGIQQNLDIGDGNVICNSAGLKDALQDAIDSGWARCQIIIWLSTLTDSNNVPDGWEYDQNNVNLDISYTH